jgi:hypothetical protein
MVIKLLYTAHDQEKGYKLYCHDGMVETWRFSLVLEWLLEVFMVKP